MPAPRTHPRRTRPVWLTLVCSAGAAVLALLVGPAPVQADGTPAPTHGSGAHDTGGHGGAGGGDRPPFDRPELVAGAALVRVETSARVTVGVELGGDFRHTVNIPVQPDTTRTGFFVHPEVVVTTASFVRRRLGVYAVNEVFGDYLRQPLEDPFAETHAEDPGVDDTLQQCYRWGSSRSDCVVKIHETVTVLPYTTDAEPLEVDARRSDAQVLFLVLDCGGRPECSEVTLPIETGTAGEEYVVIAASGKDPLTPTVTGTLTADHENPVSPSDGRVIEKQLGITAQGSPLMSPDGNVLGMVILAEDGLGAVSAQHLVDDAEKQGVEPKPGSKTHHVYQGLTFLQEGEVDQAANLLSDVAESSGQTVIAGVAQQARRESQATPSGSSGSSTEAAGVSSGAPVWPWLLIGAAVLGLLVLGAVVLARRLGGTRAVPAMAGASGLGVTGATPPGSTPTGAGSTPTGTAPASHGNPPPDPPGSATPDEARSIPEPVTGFVESPGPGSPQYCARCGTQLAPGDRYCFSCGAPTSVPGSS